MGGKQRGALTERVMFVCLMDWGMNTDFQAVFDKILEVTLVSNHITGDTLTEKVMFMRLMDWGMNTDFQAVFDKILEVALDSTV
jgi:hypothetical protein